MAATKLKSYPPDPIIINESGDVRVPLQALVDHTTRSITECQSEVLDRLSDRQLQNLKLISKWGLDGSSGHFVHKQETPEGSLQSGCDVFFTATAALQIECEENGIIVLDNLMAWSDIYWNATNPILTSCL